MTGGYKFSIGTDTHMEFMFDKCELDDEPLKDDPEETVQRLGGTVRWLINC